MYVCMYVCAKYVASMVSISVWHILSVNLREFFQQFYYSLAGLFTAAHHVSGLDFISLQAVFQGFAIRGNPRSQKGKSRFSHTTPRASSHLSLRAINLRFKAHNEVAFSPCLCLYFGHLDVSTTRVCPPICVYIIASGVKVFFRNIEPRFIFTTILFYLFEITFYLDAITSFDPRRNHTLYNIQYYFY